MWGDGGVSEQIARRRASIEELFKQMSEAKEGPSEYCPKNRNHEFKAFAHADGKDSYEWYFRCEHCGEVIVSRSKRTAEDMEYWDDDE